MSGLFMVRLLPAGKHGYARRLPMLLSGFMGNLGFRTQIVGSFGRHEGNAKRLILYGHILFQTVFAQSQFLNRLSEVLPNGGPICLATVTFYRAEQVHGGCHAASGARACESMRVLYHIFGVVGVDCVGKLLHHFRRLPEVYFEQLAKVLDAEGGHFVEQFQV
jgi:hypothetical protein